MTPAGAIQVSGRQSQREDDGSQLKRAQHNRCVPIALATARTIYQPPGFTASYPISLRRYWPWKLGFSIVKGLIGFTKGCRGV